MQVVNDQVVVHRRDRDVEATVSIRPLPYAFPSEAAAVGSDVARHPEGKLLGSDQFGVTRDRGTAVLHGIGPAGDKRWKAKVGQDSSMGNLLSRLGAMGPPLGGTSVPANHASD